MSILWKPDWETVKRGTEEFWIPAAIAAVSAAGQGVNQMNASKRAQNAEGQAIANQDTFREQANSQVKNLTQQIAQNNPQQMQAKETGDFVNTLRRNAAGSAAPGATSAGPNTNFGAPVSALPPASGANSRYNADTAASQKEVQNYGNTNAGEVSAVDSAVRQRQNEGLALNTLQTNVNGLQQQSYAKNFVDQLRANAAGQANPWVSMFSNILGKGAQAYAMNAGGGSEWTPTAGDSAPPLSLSNTIYSPTFGTAGVAP